MQSISFNTLLHLYSLYCMISLFLEKKRHPLANPFSRCAPVFFPFAEVPFYSPFLRVLFFGTSSSYNVLYAASAPPDNQSISPSTLPIIGQ